MNLLVIILGVFATVGSPLVVWLFIDWYQDKQAEKEYRDYRIGE